MSDSVIRERLTIKDLNCGNCPSYVSSTVRKGFMKCAVSDYLLNSMQNIEGHIKIVGCASHPLALQVLAGPVIEELGKRNARSKKMNVGELCAGVREGRGEAIKLLKEGVKKP